MPWSSLIFQGHGTPDGAVRQVGARLVDVARRAGVSTGTVSNVLNRPATVPEGTRERVQAAVVELGYVRTGATREFAAHSKLMDERLGHEDGSVQATRMSRRRCAGSS